MLLSQADFAPQPLCDAPEAAVVPDPATRNHFWQFYLPINSYGSTLRLTLPVHLQTPWPAALEHAAGSSLASPVTKKVYSLKKPKTHMVQHLICFKSLKSQVENPSLSHMLRDWDADFSRKSLFCLPLEEVALPLM